MKICCIYKIVSPSGKIYIGKTIDFKNRIKQYRNGFSKRQPKLHASFEKYGFINHKIAIVETCLEVDLSKREVFYIDHFKSFDTPNGMNLTEGGDGGRASILSREKMSAYRKGRIGVLCQNSVKVDQYSLDGIFIKTWDCQQDVTREFGFNQKNISAVCLGRRNVAHGFVWRFHGAKFSYIKKGQKKCKPVIKKTISGRVISVFNSIKEASGGEKALSSVISRCCNKVQKIGRGYIWEYK